MSTRVFVAPGQGPPDEAEISAQTDVAQALVMLAIGSCGSPSKAMDALMAAFVWLGMQTLKPGEVSKGLRETLVMVRAIEASR